MALVGLFCKQAVEQIVASWEKDARPQKFPQSTTKKFLERSYYRRAFHGNEVERCSVFTEVEVKAKERLT